MDANSEWNYRKIKCPPMAPDGGTFRTYTDTGEIRECTDLAALLKYVVQDVTTGHRVSVTFEAW